MYRPRPSKEQQLLFDLLKGAPPATLEGIDTTVLFDLFRRHRLFPLAGDLLPLMEEKERERWKQAKRLGSVKSLGLVTRLFESLDMLESEGINALPLKGPVLAQALYGDLSQRHMRDLDLLVSEKDLHKALEVLQASGYAQKFPGKVLTEKQWKIYLRQQYDVALVHQGQGIILELHTRIAYPELLGRMEQLITGETAAIELAGRSVPCMTLEGCFLYLAIHGAHHLFFRLFWLRDLAEALNKWDLDQQRILENARLMGAERMLGVGLKLAASFFGARIPGEYQEFLEENTVILNRLEERCHRAILDPRFYGRRSRRNVLLFSMKIKAGWTHKWHTLSSVYWRWRVRKFVR
ncbi:MAG: nucleotidyltransferase family protein [Bacteroidales bacterium]|nr:nucleotidyltransferase family protein [Bacteroidales bacterium]